MKVLTLKGDSFIHEDYRADDYRADIDKIIEVCASAGYTIDCANARAAWGVYCEEYYSTVWMSVDGMNDEWVLESILRVTQKRRENYERTNTQ